MYSKPRAPVENLLNNLRIESGIEDSKEFVSSDVYKNDETFGAMRSFDGVL